MSEALAGLLAEGMRAILRGSAPGSPRRRSRRQSPRRQSPRRRRGDSRASSGSCGHQSDCLQAFDEEAYELKPYQQKYGSLTQRQLERVLSSLPGLPPTRRLRVLGHQAQLVARSVRGQRNRHGGGLDRERAQELSFLKAGAAGRYKRRLQRLLCRALDVAPTGKFRAARRASSASSPPTPTTA